MEQVTSWRDVLKYVQAGSLFSFLFFNEKKPSLWALKEAFTKAAGADAPVERSMAAR
jgi:phosphopantetheinyl transferase (holo-ACP synthase)